MPALALALAALLAAEPLPPSLKDARAKLAALQFEATVEAASAALARGGAQPEETAELHFLAAQASAVLGRTDEATDSFARALELVPGLALVPGTSPKIAAPYRAARERLNGVRLSVVPSGKWLSDGRAQVELKIEGDVMQLVDHGELIHKAQAGHAEGGPAIRPLSRTAVPQATFNCGSPPCEYAVTLFDRPGNAVIHVGTLEAPLVVDAPAPAAVAALSDAPPAASVVEASGTAWYRHPLTWGIAAVAFGAAGAVFAARFADANARVAAIDAARAQHRIADAESADAERQVDRALFSGLFAGAAALGATALLVW